MSLKYTLEGNKVVHEEITNGSTIDKIVCNYGDSDLVGFTLNGTEYFYIRSSQSDIIGIIDSNGTQVVGYTYGTWGKLISITGTLKDTVGEKNPYRYRGYRYDTETGYYYLQSRYYNPEIGRFLNADGLVSTGQGFIGNNIFAYCLNNPVSNKDDNGFLCFSMADGGGSVGKYKSNPIVENVVYYGIKLAQGVSDYNIGNSIAKSYKKNVTQSYKPINLSAGGINVQTFKHTPKALKVANTATKWGVGAISVGMTIYSIWDNSTNYDSNIALKRNMVDVIWFGLGCAAGVFIGASALPVTVAAGLTIGAGILIGVSADMFKENISN